VRRASAQHNALVPHFESHPADAEPIADDSISCSTIGASEHEPDTFGRPVRRNHKLTSHKSQVTGYNVQLHFIEP
jgi:hypothetical protein